MKCDIAPLMQSLGVFFVAFAFFRHALFRSWSVDFDGSDVCIFAILMVREDLDLNQPRLKQARLLPLDSDLPVQTAQSCSSWRHRTNGLSPLEVEEGGTFWTEHLCEINVVPPNGFVKVDGLGLEEGMVAHAREDLDGGRGVALVEAVVEVDAQEPDPDESREVNVDGMWLGTVGLPISLERGILDAVDAMALFRGGDGPGCLGPNVPVSMARQDDGVS